MPRAMKVSRQRQTVQTAALVNALVNAPVNACLFVFHGKPLEGSELAFALLNLPLSLQGCWEVVGHIPKNTLCKFCDIYRLSECY